MPRPHGSMKKKEKARDFKGTVSKLLSYTRPYYFKVIFVLILTVVSTLLSIIAPKVTGNATTLLFEGIVSKYTGGAGIDFSGIFNILVTLTVILIGSFTLNYLSGWILTKVSNDISYNLRKDISEKINRLPLKYFDSKSHGDILSRVTNDVDNISQNLNSSIQNVLSGLVTVVGVLWMMFSISFKLTVIALLIVPLSGVVAGLVVKVSQKYFFDNQKYLGQVNGHIEEMYAGHLVVKTYNYEDKSIEKFDELNDKLFNASYKSQFLSAIMHPIIGFLGNIGYVAVCLFGSLEVIHGHMPIGDIQAFIQYVRQLNQPITSIAQIMNVIQSMVAAAERVFEILDEEEMVEDTSNPVAIHDEKGKLLIDGNVTFENVRFGYDKDKIIIHDFSMYVAPGKQVAIIGPTGAGKTTLVKLLMRFYELNGGNIYIDGHNITDMTRSDLRSLFGMVLQDTWLYSGSIRDNIRYGKDDASDEDVIKACQMAYADHFIRTLPEGYDTILSDEVNGISQGQKQLLTIARAFLKDPKILILDEATSSVDTRTEELIEKGMERLMKGRTTFVIAHRLSTIRNADIIVVLNDGDIVEVGNHSELMERKGFYFNLYNSQFEA